MPTGNLFSYLFACGFSVLQLHREFSRAGADVAQSFTFYASEDKLENRGNEAGKIGVRNRLHCRLTTTYCRLTTTYCHLTTTYQISQINEVSDV